MNKIRQDVMGIITFENKLLLVKQRKANYWNFPKGGVNTNESNEDALKRELFEETGLTNIKILKEIKQTLYFDLPLELQKETGFKGKLCHIFLIESKTKKINLDYELSDFKWVKKEELFKMLDYENLKDLSKIAIEEFEKFGITIF